MVFEYFKDAFDTFLKFCGIKKVNSFDEEDFEYDFSRNRIYRYALLSFVDAKLGMFNNKLKFFKKYSDSFLYSNTPKDYVLINLKNCKTRLDEFDYEIFSLIPNKFKQIKEIKKEDFDIKTDNLLIIRTKIEKIKENVIWITNYYEQRYNSLVNGNYKEEKNRLIKAVIETRDMFNDLDSYLESFSIYKKSKTKRIR